MQVRQVQVRGCLPALVALLVVGALVAALVTASVAFAAVALGAAVLAALLRWIRSLSGAPRSETSAPRRRAADVTIDAEVVEPLEGTGGGSPPRRLE